MLENVNFKEMFEKTSMKNKDVSGKVKTLSPEHVSKQNVVQTLAEEGMMMTTNSIDEITDQSIIDAQHNVIKKFQQDRKVWLTVQRGSDDLIQQFYRAAQRANISVTRNARNEIVLTKV